MIDNPSATASCKTDNQPDRGRTAPGSTVFEATPELATARNFSCASSLYQHFLSADVAGNLSLFCHPQLRPSAGFEKLRARAI
jgi:hypothetical protein